MQSLNAFDARRLRGFRHLRRGTMHLSVATIADRVCRQRPGRYGTGGRGMARLQKAHGSTSPAKALTRKLCYSWCAMVAIFGAALDSTGTEPAADESDDASLSQLLNVARDELEAAELSEKEIQL